MNIVHKIVLLAAVATVFGGSVIRADDPSGAKPLSNKPLTFKDGETGIILYVESDGRHVAAIDRNGVILWHRNPFEEKGTKPYRKSRPVIARVAPATDGMVESMRAKGYKGPFVEVNFNSTQTFVLDQMTGESIFYGQD